MHTRRILTTALFVTIALATVSAPALAYPIGPGFGVNNASHAVTPTYSRQDKQVITPVTYVAPPAAHPAPVAPGNAPADGFTALDIALVASAGLALLLLLIGGATARSRRRALGAHRPAAATH